ncbi:MAG: hypothetical protein DME02_08075 [Candidatus Rokuibacteriota bacterium]|nr:MAG: hypothetical protein DME02_08075 [Candidatus Rokubacteria bacterium]
MRRVAIAAAVALLAMLPLVPSVFGSYAVTLFTLIFFYGFLGQAWNIVGGYAGQLSAGHAAFLGIGAYTAALLSVERGVTPWLGMCRIIVSNTEALGGAVGYYITFTGDPRQFQFQDARAYYYVALVMMLAVTGIVAWLERRRFGVYLSAIREDESACEALGVNTFRYKMLAMMLSSFLTGIGGAFYAFYLFSLQPASVFGIPLSVEIIIRAIVGGAGTVLGPILGSFILSPLAELARYYFAQGGWHGAHLVVYGLLLIAVVLFLPEGAYPRLARLFRR